MATLIALLCVIATHACAAPIAEASEEQLERWLRQYPEADADGDGKLTVREAEAYRRQLQKKQAAKDRFSFEHEFTFATMTDGVKIALAVGYPKGFDRAGAERKWPAVFMMCGYDFSVPPLDPGQFGNRCVTVNVSLRGSGASGGVFRPWEPRTRQDGYEVIENWIVKQQWSNGRVGIVGHSWPGLMGFLVATTNPPSVKAVCVSGLIEDFYRGIARIGGVRNCGFPVYWLNAYYSPQGPFGSTEAAREIRGIDGAQLREILASRPERDLRQDMLWLLLKEPYFSPKLEERSLCTHASRIRAPILMGHSYQDEQTGPTGLWLWRLVPEDVPKRLVLTNGNHGAIPATNPDMAAWFEHFLLGEGDGSIADPERRVQCYFETRLEGPDRKHTLNAPLEAADFPLPETRWSRYCLRSRGVLTKDPPGEGEGPRVYRVGIGDRMEDDERIEYTLEFDEPTAICGPITLTLWAKTTTLDTDFFALVGDRGPDGEMYGLQRGLLRASRRELDEGRSMHVEQDGRKLLIRPRHPHVKAEPVTPRQAYRYEIEISPVGHVFRAGHTLVLRLSRPPQGDPIGVTRSGAPSYQYDSEQPPGTVQILHDRAHASSLLLPVLPTLPPIPAEPPGLDYQAGLQPAP